jgi:putative endonuclease
MYTTYVLFSEKYQRYYIGSTSNLVHRLEVHNSGKTISTKAYRPWRIVYSESFRSLAEARRREQQIKSWKNPDYMKKLLNITC